MNDVTIVLLIKAHLQRRGWMEDARNGGCKRSCEGGVSDQGGDEFEEREIERF